MMSSLENTRRRRELALMIIRAGVIVMLTLAAIAFIVALRFQLSVSRGGSFQLGWFIVYGRHMDLVYSFSFPAVLLLILDRRLARWLVPVPRHECPQCGYSLHAMGSDTCPECGLVLRQADRTRNAS